MNILIIAKVAVKGIGNYLSEDTAILGCFAIDKINERKRQRPVKMC